MSERRLLLSAIAAFAILILLELPGSPLIEPDEARYAEIPREMLAAHDLVTPRLDGMRYYEKPPLLYWANAASFTLLGETPFAARLAARISAFGTAALIAVSLGGELGLWAALILLSAPLSFVLARYNVTDGVLTFAMTLTLVAMRAFLRRRERELPASGALALLGLGAGLAVLAKGLIGIVLPGLVFLIWIAILGEWRRLRELLISPAPIVFAFVAVPWFVLMERANPGFSQVFFIREHLQRFATNEAKREAPAYFFVLAFIGGFLPWTLPFGAWIAWMVGARVRTRAAFYEHRDELLLTLWFLVIVVFFSASRSKLLPYILPAFPAAAALAALAIVRGVPGRGALLGYAVVTTVALGGGLAFALPKGVLAPYHATAFAVAGIAALVAGAWLAWWISARDARRALIAAAAGWGGLYLALILALPRIASEVGTESLARAAAGVPSARIVAYQNYPQGFAWTLRHPIPVADFTGELATDGARPPELFWSKDDFWRRWHAGEPMAVVLRRRALADWRAQGDSSPVTVASNQTYLVVTNVPRTPAAIR